MAIKNAKTINEYKILKWIDEHFEPDSVSVEFLSETKAQITDCHSDTMILSIEEDTVSVG